MVRVGWVHCYQTLFTASCIMIVYDPNFIQIYKIANKFLVAFERVNK